jgi:hypothetical protein
MGRRASPVGRLWSVGLLCRAMVASAAARDFVAKPLVHSTPPTFTLDLARAPEDRWTGVMDLFEAPPQETWIPIFAYHNRSLFHRLTPRDFAFIANAVSQQFPEQAGELRSMSREFSRIGFRVSFEYLCAWAYSHELGHMPRAPPAADRRDCTAIVSQDVQGGMHHVGLMDQDPIEIRWVVIHARIVRGGALLCEGSDWYWFTTGMTRMVRRGVATLQENWRTGAVDVARSVVFRDIGEGVVPQSWAFRQALTTAALDAFEPLLTHLAVMRLGAPYYVAVTGAHPSQAAVFARSNVDEPGTVTGPGIERLNGTWYLVQANDDRWRPDPYTDFRRTYAETALDQAGRERGATALGLLGVANIFPVRNPRTSHIAVMSAKDGTLDTFVLEPTIVVDRRAYADQRLTYAIRDPLLYFGDASKLQQPELYLTAQRGALERHPASSLAVLVLGALGVSAGLLTRIGRALHGGRGSIA